jgi:hypothetical protein
MAMLPASGLNRSTSWDTFPSCRRR